MGAAYRNLVLLLVGFTIVFAILVISNKSNIRGKNSEVIVSEFNHNLNKQSKILQQELQKYITVLNTESIDYWPLLEHIEEGGSYYVFVYSNSNLLYWNSSDILINNLPKKDNPFLINDLNSWYIGGYEQVGDYEIYLLKAIISDYSVKNQHIKKIVNKDFSSFKNLSIVDHKVIDSYKIVFSGQNQYYLKIIKDDYKQSTSIDRKSVV